MSDMEISSTSASESACGSAKSRGTGFLVPAIVIATILTVIIVVMGSEMTKTKGEIASIRSGQLNNKDLDHLASGVNDAHVAIKLQNETMIKLKKQVEALTAHARRMHRGAPLSPDEEDTQEETQNIKIAKEDNSTPPNSPSREDMTTPLIEEIHTE